MPGGGYELAPDTAGVREQVVASYKLQATSYKLRVTSYELQATSYKLQATSVREQVVARHTWGALCIVLHSAAGLDGGYPAFGSRAQSFAHYMGRRWGDDEPKAHAPPRADLELAQTRGC